MLDPCPFCSPENKRSSYEVDVGMGPLTYESATWELPTIRGSIMDPKKEPFKELTGLCLALPG